MQGTSHRLHTYAKYSMAGNADGGIELLTERARCPLCVHIVHVRATSHDAPRKRVHVVHMLRDHGMLKMLKLGAGPAVPDAARY